VLAVALAAWFREWYCHWLDQRRGASTAAYDYRHQRWVEGETNNPGQRVPV
jgi:hypothetical protein